MNTAVQLRRGLDEGPRSEILYGAPHQTVAGRLGPIALFAPGELVAFRIGQHRRTRLFVFRTLAVDDRLAATVPGVHPRVQLLFDVRTLGRTRLVRGLFGYLARTGRDPGDLSDDFYVRVGVVLGGRLPPHKVLVSLLSPPQRPGQVIGDSASGAWAKPSIARRRRP
jgi:hypothetical protein